MTREQAVSKLQGKSFGTFLIRRSPRNPSDDYVLSVAETGKIANYIIHKEQDHYKIGDQIFSDVPQLLEHYRVNYLDTTMLTQPVQRDNIGGGGPTPKLPTKDVCLGYVVAKFDFQGQDEEDLPFKKGEILEITKRQEEKWWTARNEQGRIGSIPVPYVEATSAPRQNSQRHSNPNPQNPNFPSQRSDSRPNSLPDANRQVFARVIMRRVPNAYDPEALPLEIGDIIKVTRRNVTGQWEGTKVASGKSGHFPFTHVKIVDPSEINSH